MKKTFFLSKKFVAIFMGILLLGCFPGCRNDIMQTENANAPETAGLKSASMNNFMVITKSEKLPACFENQLAGYGQIVKRIPEIGVVVVKPTVSGFEAKIAKLTEVKTVVPDLAAQWIEPVKFTTEANPPSIGSDETYFPYLWGMDAINAPEAWNAGFTGKKAKVFILDNGIDAEHPDLAPNLNTELSTSFVPDEDYNIQSGAYFNHGTHVAGIIAAADNQLGVIGVAPEAEIVAVKVLSELSGSGMFSWINEGIVYAANNGANVINMSLGATFNRNGFYIDDDGMLQKIPAVYIQSLILAQQRAVNYAFRKGAVIICSAGNGASNFDGNASIFKIPAELQNVIAVSATAPDYWYRDLVGGITPNLDVPASYTDFGKSLVALAAPGGDFDFVDYLNGYFDMVLSTSSQSYYFAAGTSMASPHAAGVAALIIAKYEGKITPQEVTKQLLKTADKIDGNGTTSFYGKGRVNAFRAVTE